MREITSNGPSHVGPILATALAVVIMVGGGLWLGLWALITEHRQTELNQLHRRAELAARSLEHETRETVARLDLGLKVVQAEIERVGWQIDFLELQKKGLLLGNEVSVVAVADTDGRVRNGLHVDERASMADRDFFLVHARQTDAGLFVGRPTSGSNRDAPSVHFTRRLVGADGSFRGVALAAVEPKNLIAGAGTVEIEKGLIAAIFGLDGIVRAARLDQRVSSGETIADLPVIELAAKEPVGTFTARSSVDDIVRIYAYRRVAGLTLGVLVGIPHQAALMRTRSFEADLLLIGWLATGALVIFAGLIAMFVNRQRALLMEAQGALASVQLANHTVEDERKKAEAARRLADDAKRQANVALHDGELARERALEARRIAEAANRTKTEFLASMSHELRTPLNSVVGFAQLLSTDPAETLTENQAASVAAIERNGAILIRLIDDVLDFAKIESGDFEFRPAAFKVSDLLADVDRDLKPLASRKDVTLIVETSMIGSQSIVADRMRALQILTNLGSNAIKYNRPKGRVSVSASAQGEMLRLEVSDTGLGIPADKQAELFAPFKRLGREMGTTEGTGIGLSISRQLARKMGGDIKFTSQDGIGSRFWLELPRQFRHAADRQLDEGRSTSTNGPTAAEAAMSEPTTNRAGDDSLILYVEDNSANTILMERIMAREAGLKLMTAENAAIGLDLARRLRPAIVVMDLNLPGMDGFEALRVLKSMPETAKTPVIALTASAQPRDVEKGMAAGFVAYLTKPIDITLFLGKIREILGDRRR